MIFRRNHDITQTPWWSTALQTALMVLTLTIVVAAEPQKHEKQKAKGAQNDLPAVIWRDPGNISSLNLIYGTGGQENAPDPNGTYTFLKEDLHGTSAKFDVKDANGVKWRIKTGAEPQSETAATRLLWAAGYFVDQDYYLPEVRVDGLPKLRRGENYVTDGRVVHGARLERKDERIKDAGNWNWFNNRFKGSRELNGLRVMMALVNNWDLKEVNNSIYIVNGEQRYVVSDVGASFGKTGNNISRSKSDEEGYEKSGFIEKQTERDVDFEMHSRPFLPTIVNLPNYRGRTRMEEITKHIPRADAKWIGGLLGQLTEEQIRDCFRSAGYSPEEIEGYTGEIRKRIAALNAL